MSPGLPGTYFSSATEKPQPMPHGPNARVAWRASQVALVAVPLKPPPRVNCFVYFASVVQTESHSADFLASVMAPLLRRST
jgi:hypothetical protein